MQEIQIIKELPDLNDDLIEILGRPNFHCGNLANLLRLKGSAIPFKAEAEQASVIYALLSVYLEDPVNWRERAREVLLSGFVQQNERMGFGTVTHIGSACALIDVQIYQRKDVDTFEPFMIKAIFEKPYVLEKGIFFTHDTATTKAILQNLKAGEVFDTSLLPEGWMTYDQFFDKLDQQHSAGAPAGEYATYPEDVPARDDKGELIIENDQVVLKHKKGDVVFNEDGVTPVRVHPGDTEAPKA